MCTVYALSTGADTGALLSVATALILAAFDVWCIKCVVLNAIEW